MSSVLKKSTRAASVAAIAWAVLGGGASFAQENASNPLAAVNNTDIRYQFIDLGEGADKQDAFIDGAYMVRPDLQLKYELHYNSTDASGSRETGFEKLNVKNRRQAVEKAKTIGLLSEDP